MICCLATCDVRFAEGGDSTFGIPGAATPQLGPPGAGVTPGSRLGARGGMGTSPLVVSPSSNSALLAGLGNDTPSPGRLRTDRCSLRLLPMIYPVCVWRQVHSLMFFPPPS